MLIALTAALSTMGALWWNFGASETSDSFLFRPGERAVYDFHYDLLGRARVAQGRMGTGESSSSLETSTRLEGEVVFEWVTRHLENVVVSMKFSQLDNAELLVMGADVLADGGSAVLKDAAAFVEFEPDGRIAAVRFDEGTNELFSNLCMALLGDLQIIRDKRGAESWTTRETNSVGDAEVSYHRAINDVSEQVLTKRRVEYETVLAVAAAEDISSRVLDSGFEALLNNDGFLRRLSGAETLTVRGAEGEELMHHEVALDLTLARHEEASPPRAMSKRVLLQEPRHLGDVRVSEQSQHAALLQRAAGMTVDQMIGDLRTFTGGEMPFHSAWVWQTTGLLALDPKACKALSELAMEAGASTKNRAFMLEMLASTNTNGARQALLDILKSKEVRRDPGYDQLVQRLIFVDKPSKSVGEFAASLVEHSDDTESPVYLSGLHTVGAVAHKLRAAGSTEAAERLDQLLLDNGTLAGNTQEETLARVAGAGNASSKKHGGTHCAIRH